MLIPIILAISFCLIDLSECVYNEMGAQKWFDICLDEMNPSSVYPPRTDNGAQSPFKYSFSLAHRGTWLKWDCKTLCQWLYGNARITCIEEGGRAFVDDVKAGDLWFFPGGAPHSIQGTGDDGAFFLLVFNDGNFNEFGTILLTDTMNHEPRDVLAKNFQVPKSVFNNIPDQPLYIFSGQLPGPLEADREYMYKVTGPVPQSLTFYTDQMRPNYTRNGGSVKVIDSNNFPVTTISGSIITLKPGAMREIHWHPNADEWQYYVQGSARVTVFAAGGEARTMDFKAGDVGYVQQSLPHYIENTCNETGIFLEVFASPFFEDISLSQWFAHLPPLLLNQHIRTGENFIRSINKREAIIVP